MELLHEFFDPIPLAALLAAVFALITFIVIAKILRLPDNFAEKETVRNELRFRIVNQRRANLSGDDVEGHVEKAAGEAEHNEAGKKEAESPEKKDNPEKKA
jgi:hypothetical protein